MTVVWSDLSDGSQEIAKYGGKKNAADRSHYLLVLPPLLAAEIKRALETLIQKSFPYKETV